MTRVALLTNFVPPYRLPTYEALSELVDLRVILADVSEPNRRWRVDHGDLNVTVLRGWSWQRRLAHADGYVRSTTMHLPANVAAELGRSRPDVVVSGELGARTMQAAAYCVARRVPLVIWVTLSEHTERSVSAPQRALRAWLLQRAAVVIGNGSEACSYVTSLGVPPERVVNVPNAAPAPATARPPRRRRVTRFVVVGQLIERKNLVAALRALDAAVDPDSPVEVAVAGDGPLCDQVRSAAGPGVRLELLGHVEPAELGAVYASADALLFPTLGDAWGLVVNEAMAVGVPVAGSTRAQAVTELVRDGVDGWHLDVSSEAALTRDLSRVLETPGEVVDRMGNSARQRVGRVTPAAMASGMNLAIEKALSR